jgi:hypothetical protein
LDLPPENFQSIAQVATEILNISCAKLIIGLQEFFLATKIVILRSPACNCRKKMSLCCSCHTVEALISRLPLFLSKIFEIKCVKLGPNN